PTPGGKAPPGKTPTAPEAPSPEVQRAQQIADLEGQADAALGSRNYEGAAGLYDQILKLDPQNAKAGAGKASAQAGLAAMKKTFVAGHTTVSGGQKAKGGLSGFESEDVNIAKAPDYSGRIEFEASPATVKAGDNFSVKVYLLNDGKKGFKIG